MLLPPDPPAGRDALAIGLLNLLPDEALRSGEHRLVALLRGTGVALRLHLLTPRRITRGAAARGHLVASGYRYGLPDRPLDGLVVTGAEPRAAVLTAETFWPELAAAVDWARANTRSTVFSCLAAHAAVLHLDRVPRRRLVRKCFGLFPVEPAGPEGYRGPVSHSRWHDLDERDLLAAGYAVLGRMRGGVDSFEKRVGGSRFLFLQGHPEYHGGTLGREYRRDVGRFVGGMQERYPELPVGYYGEPEALLLRFREAAERARSSGRLSDRLDGFPLVAPPRGAGRAGVAVLGGWLRSLAETRR